MHVVAAVNAPYLRLLDIWMAQSGKFLPQAMNIVCMDEQAAEHCRQNYPAQIETAQANMSDARDRHTFWNARLGYLAKLIRDGEDFLHTDLDAFWLKNPLPTLAKIDADLVFTMDMGIPDKVRKVWGFTLCCGFFLARSSKASRLFFDAWQKRTQELGDDQIAANEILFAKGITWQTHAALPEGGHWGECQFDGETLKLAVLPLSHVPRYVPFYEQDALVVHPWFERSLFHGYLGLLEFTLAHFGRLNPDAHEAPLPPGLSTPESLDECSSATWRMVCHALHAQPDNTQFLTLRGAMYMRADELPLALADFRRAQQLGELPSALRLWLAQALVQNGEHGEASALVTPMATDRNAELPSIRLAAQIIKKTSGPIAASCFLFRALRGFGLKKTCSIAYAWCAKKLAS